MSDLEISQELWRIMKLAGAGGSNVSIDGTMKLIESIDGDCLYPLLEILSNGTFDEAYYAMLGLRHIGYECYAHDDESVDGKYLYKIRIGYNDKWTYILGCTID